jgi:2-methylcitrate dehydratase PrpD
MTSNTDGLELSLSQHLAQWCCETPYDALPADVIAATKLRILDTIGLALAGRTFDIGHAVLKAGARQSETGRAAILGGPDGLPAQTAALVNGVLAEAIEFDDSHNETVVHVSSPVVAAALACAEAERSSGRDLIHAVALGSEVCCRIAIGAPGAFHPLGFHPTGIFGAFGAAAASAALLRVDAASLAHTLGIAGSFASGLLESWSDGTWGKLVNPGWSAQAGITAARLGASGFTGPRTVLEGKFGLFASHLQNPAAAPSLLRVTKDLGREWESRAISFKPYPNAHVMHGVLDAVRHVIDEGVDVNTIASVHCLVAPYMVSLICEPEAEKFRPPSSAQARISLHHTVAEMLRTGVMDVTSYSDAALQDPAVQKLADRVSYSVVAEWTSRTAYPGGVRVTMDDGTIIERIETANLGSASKPMSAGDVEDKFRINAGLVLPESQVEEIVKAVRDLEKIDQVSRIAALTLPR